METPTPTLSPSDRFNCLVEGLFSDVATRATNGWFPLPPVQLVLIKLIWRRLRRMSRRFAAIMARFHAGTLAEVARPGRLARRTGRVRSSRRGASAGLFMRFPGSSGSGTTNWKKCSRTLKW